MSFKIYLRDWYYNSGIIGFLKVLSENKRNIEEIKQHFNASIEIKENHIEFEDSLLNNFYEKYKKVAFDMFFSINDYKKRINSLIQKIQEDEKITKKLLQETALTGKVVNEFIKKINKGIDLNDVFSGSNIKQDVQNISSIINAFNSNNDVYIRLQNINQGSDFISYFLDNELTRRVCSYSNVEEYIQKITSNQILAEQHSNRKCFICGEYKKEYDFSNAITQILGFNSDNSNWIWGYQASKAKICALCALIYTCAPLGMVFLNKKFGSEYKTFFYALNRNTDITTLYHSYWIFKEKISREQNQNKPFYTILQEVVLELLQQQAQAVIENINFIEIAENNFGGQSTKSYNIYNYNITKELALFIKEIGKEGVPKGFYKNRDFYSDMAEEILKKTLEHTLNFSDLSNYFEYFIRSLDPKSSIVTVFSINKVTNYTLKYINRIKGGNIMAQEQIVKKAFFNGRSLAEKIGQDNKIKGVAYQLLNDLKISDRNAFMDKYLRLSMSYGCEVTLGSNNELTDIDNFMSFGYAFVNGLLANINTNNQNNNEEVSNG